MTPHAAAAVRYHVATAAEVPVGDDWLTVHERGLLARFRVRKRIQDWRLGRFAAKHAVAGALDEPRLAPEEVEIRPARSGAPTAWSGGMRLPVELSLSHTGGRAVCAVAPFRRPVGCDIEKIESRARVFERDFFTDSEIAWLDRVANQATRPAWVTLVWSAKESALKALTEGLRMDTRDVTVEPPAVPRLPGPEWARFDLVESKDGRRWFGWWRVDEAFTVTIVTHVGTEAPLRVG